MRCRRCDCQSSSSQSQIELRIGNDFPASIEKTAGLHRVFKLFMALKLWQSKVRFEGTQRSVGPPCGGGERLSNSTSLLRSVTLSPAILYDLSLKGRRARPPYHHQLFSSGWKNFLKLANLAPVLTVSQRPGAPLAVPRSARSLAC